eukprot:3136673-Pleurochrysis_carterae.AAC.3
MLAVVICVASTPLAAGAAAASKASGMWPAPICLALRRRRCGARRRTPSHRITGLNLLTSPPFPESHTSFHIRRIPDFQAHCRQYYDLNSKVPE